jgi:hypothetical protein
MGLTHNEAIGLGVSLFIILWILWRCWKLKIKKQQQNRTILPIILRPQRNHQTSRRAHVQPVPPQILIPTQIRPIPLNVQQQRILNHILTPTTLRDDLNDTSRLYVDKIIDMTPEHQLLPLQVLDEKYEGEQCMVCLDILKWKGRPVVKLGCEDHYFHYSCYETFLDDDNKKKEVELLFGESKHIDDMYSVKCPICRTKTAMELVYINYPEFDIPIKNNNILKESYLSNAKSSYASANSGPILNINSNSVYLDANILSDNVSSDNESSDNEYKTVDELEEIALDDENVNETTPLVEHF